MTIGLYVVVVLIWGTTWIAIAFQLGEVPIIWSIVYRFAVAAVVLWLWSLLAGERKRPGLGDQPLLMLQGLCLFALNFLCFYSATRYIPSGLVSVVFSTATLWNALNARLFFGTPISAPVVLGGALGLCGLTGLLLPALSTEDRGVWPTLAGSLLAVAGTYCFSLGNLLAVRLQARGLSPWVTNAPAMAYGTAVLALIALLGGIAPTFDIRPTYLGALAYLAIPGSVIGFTAYLTLVGRIGAQRAAYATVLFPVVALLISTWVEDYRWTLFGVAGIVLVALGNVVVFRARSPSHPPVSSPAPLMAAAR